MSKNGGDDRVDVDLDMDASGLFAQALTIQVNQQDVELMINAQKHMMSRFEKTSEMLINCNALSAVRLHSVNQEFKRHTTLLIDMMKDLDAIFKRIRNLKSKLSSQYPQAFKACSCSATIQEDEQTTKDSAESHKDFRQNDDTIVAIGNTSEETTCLGHPECGASLQIPGKIKRVCQSSSCSRSSSAPSLPTSPSTSDS